MVSMVRSTVGIVAESLRRMAAEGVAVLHKTVLAGVSGGADSVALLLILLELQGEFDMAIRAAHVEHGIRGADSLADQRFVEELCERLGVPLTVVTVDALSFAKESGGGVEDAARRLRYDAFERVMRETGADYVATAHHRGDQAETVLMRILRGAGIHGLAGMSATRGRIIRPLLNMTPGELREYLNERNQAWREDATNRDENQPRAFIRHNLLPMMRRVNADAEGALIRLAESAARDDAYMRKAADAFVSGNAVEAPYGYIIRKAFDADAAIMSRVLIRLVDAVCGRVIDKAKNDEIIRMIQSGRRAETEAAKGVSVLWAPPNLHIIARRDVAPLDLSVQYKDNFTMGESDGILSQIIPRRLPEGAEFRYMRRGDFIQPFGMSGRVSLSDYFINRKVDRPVRGYVPLLTLTNTSEVLWAVGIGASECLRYREDDDMADFVLAQWTRKPFYLCKL